MLQIHCQKKLLSGERESQNLFFWEEMKWVLLTMKYEIQPILKSKDILRDKKKRPPNHPVCSVVSVPSQRLELSLHIVLLTSSLPLQLALVGIPATNTSGM